MDAELPGESELLVSGRQSVDFGYESTSFTNDPERDDETNLNIDQQLQFHVRGSIADERLVVDMNFNGSLPEVERQDIKVQYNGLERDIGFATSQTTMEFGDVRLSLPGSHFVTYNKRVFGLTGQSELRDIDIFGWQPQQFKFYGVASQEEGQTQKKVFEGKNRRQIPDPIPDIQPIHRRYYQLLADTPESNRPAISVNSEQIFHDDQNKENNDDNTIEDKVVKNGDIEDTGDFDQLEPGDDYAIDYQSGVIRFKTNISSEDVLAYSLTLTNGTEITDFMFKDEDESDTFDRYHLRNRYQLAGRNLVRDDPDRVLEVRDETNRSAPDGSNQTYNERLGLDSNNDGVIDDQFIDFELGVLRFPDTLPFINSNLPDTNPTVYGPPAERVEKFNIYQEVLVRENIYQLDFNVVQGSENITVDGQSMVRNQDYTIDYQTGFVQFFDRVQVDEDSRIEITFESKSFGNRQDETFIGGRMEADISDNLSFGSTVLSDQEDELGRVPQVGEETTSTLVNEFDVGWNPLHTTQDILAGLFGYSAFSDHPWDEHLELELEAEWAQSSRVTNQQGKAVVDDFQNLDQRVPFSKNDLNWHPADPVQQFPGDDSQLDHRSPFELDRRKEEGFDPDPDDDKTQRSLEITVTPDETQDTWTSLQHRFTGSERDLRGFQFIEFWVKWEDDSAGGTLSVDVGRLSEDVNRNGVLNTEDSNGDDVLNPGEDNGYEAGADFIFGADNGVLNTEDLSGNGFLDTKEGYLHFPSINRATAVDTQATSHGWTRYRIPLNDQVFGELRGNANLEGDNPTDTPTLDEVLRTAQTVRLVYEAPDGSSDRRFLLDQMGMVRTSWQTNSDTDRFSLDVVSEAGDPGRLPAPGSNSFIDIDSDRLNQALGITFQNLRASDSPTSNTFLNKAASDQLNIYKKLNILFNTSEVTANSPDSAFLQFGKGSNDFFRYTFDMDNPASDPWIVPVNGSPDDWFRLSINLQRFEQDLIDKTLADSDTFREGQRLIKGNPSLRDVQRYRIGLIGPEAPGTAEGQLLFDLFHTSSPIEEEGGAFRVNSQVNLREGLLNLNFTKRDIDGEFQTIGLVNSATANEFVQQDEESKSMSGSVDINRYIPSDWGIRIPFQFDWSEQETELPADRAERVRDDQLGTITDENFSWSSGLKTPSLFPDFNFDWDEQTKSVNQIQRDNRWDLDKDRWKLSANYSLSFSEPIFGYLPVGEGLSFRTSTGHEEASEQRQVKSGGTKERDREQTSRDFDYSMDIRPWSWLDISPGYEFRDRKRKTLEGEGLDLKNQHYNLAVSVDPGVEYWGLTPSYDFSINGSDQFNSDNFSSENTTFDLDGNNTLRIQTDPESWWDPLGFLSLDYTFNLSNSATYRNAPEGNNLLDAYSDFFGGLGWIITGADLEVGGDSLSLSRNRASFQSSHRLSGTIDFWEPVNTRYNFSHTNNKGQSDNSISSSNATSFSLNNRFQLVKMSDWFKNHTQSSSFKFDYQLSLTESGNKEGQDHQFRLGLNTRWNKWWSTNFNLNTTLGQTEDQAVKTDSTRWNPSMDFKWLVNEQGGDGGTLWFDNRLEINGGISGSIEDRTRNGETRADNWQVSGNFGGDYNISQWIKTSFSGNFSMFNDDFQEANDRRTWGMNASVDFRF